MATSFNRTYFILVEVKYFLTHKRKLSAIQQEAEQKHDEHKHTDTHSGTIWAFHYAPPISIAQIHTTAFGTAHNAVEHLDNVRFASCDDSIVNGALKSQSTEYDTMDLDTSTKRIFRIVQSFRQLAHDLFHCSFFISSSFIRFPHPFAYEI